MIEATGVRPDGRISPYDLGLWNDHQSNAFARLARSITAAGSIPGVQLAHAGRKASVDKPWLGGEPMTAERNGWPTISPSGDAYPGYLPPAEMSEDDIRDVVRAFADSARRALDAGFEVVEVHAAHGYLLHSFLSPASNKRTDNYGGSFENRVRFPLEVIDAVREVWPEELPVFLRLSTTDWIEEDPSDDRTGWTVDETVRFSRLALEHGIDLIDCSSGGLEPVPIPRNRDYQTRYAACVRAEVDAPVAAVGRITDPHWAAELIGDETVDAIFLGRALLRDPSWVNAAAASTGERPRFVEQYDYAL